MRDLIERLEVAEENFKNALLPFLRTMFKNFFTHKEIFARAV
jgi:hypothetical protein